MMPRDNGGTLDKTDSPPSTFNLDATEWEVLYLLYDALDQLRKMTLSFSELRYLAVEHTEEQIRAAVESLLANPDGRPPLILQVPNLANLPIYRITPTGRDLVKRQRGMAGSVSPLTSQHT
jgi:hypothetical protein